MKALQACGCEVLDWPFDACLEWYERSKASHEGMTTEDAVRLAVNAVERMAYRFWPDVILVTSAFYLPTDTLDVFRDRGHTVVLLHAINMLRARQFKIGAILVFRFHVFDQQA